MSFFCFIFILEESASAPTKNFYLLQDRKQEKYVFQGISSANVIIITKMMIEFLAFLLIGVSLLFFKFYWRPYKEHQWYVQQFRRKGYRVLEVPFRPFALTFLDIYDYSEKTKDALRIVKEKYPHYDVAIMNLVDGIFIDLINPDLIQDFFSAQNFSNYHKSKLQKDNMQRALGEGIVFNEDHMWKKKRRVLNSAFNFDFIKSLTPKIANLCDKALEQMQEGFTGSKVEYDVHDYTSKLAGDVMLSCFFGQDHENEQIQGFSVPTYFGDIMGDINLQRGDFCTTVLGAKFLNLGLREKDRSLNRRLKLYKEWGHRIVGERVEEIKQKIERGEISETSNDLIQAITRNSMKGEGNYVYTEENIFDEFNTFFLAGFDTVSNYLITMIYLIAQHPEVESKVREEIKQFLKDDDYSYENLKKMTYIDCVEKEVTRFYGPANNVILREAAKDHFLKEVPIRKSTFFGVNYMGMHYSEEFYQNPTEFKPERWMNECKNIPTFAVGGFGSGPRSCIGKHLAKLQAKIGLVKFLKRYEKMELANEKVEMLFRFLYQPKNTKTKLTKSDENL